MTKEIHFTDENPIPPVTFYANAKILADLKVLIDQAKSVDAAEKAKAKENFRYALADARKYRSVHVEGYKSDSVSVIFDLDNPLVALLHEAEEAGILPRVDGLVEGARAQPRTLRVEVPWTKIKAITEPVTAAASSISV
jgi:hypothetical protein